jgi:hypothetical protein
MRRLGFGLASRTPGRSRGSARRLAARSLADRGRCPPEKRGPGLRSVALKRRKARRHASWAGDGPQPQGGHRCGDPHRRLSALPPPRTERKPAGATGRRQQPGTENRTQIIRCGIITFTKVTRETAYETTT